MMRPGSNLPVAGMKALALIICVGLSPGCAWSLLQAMWLDSQAAQMYHQGRYADSLVPAKKSLEIRLQLLGEKHPDTATSYTNLGLLYEYAGDFGKAEPLLEKALSIVREVSGEKHPLTATCYNNLGMLYHVMGNYGRAKQLYRKCLAIRKEVLGEKHRDTAASYSNLGTLYEFMGDFGKAEPLKQKALAILREVSGEKHSFTATCYNNLGMLYHVMGDYAKAEPLYQKGLTIRREVLGEKHPDTAASYSNLGALYQSLGDYGKAEPHLQQALSIMKEDLGERHPNVATCCNNLGHLYENLGDYEKAETFLQKALEIRRAILGEKHPDTAGSYNNLGVLYDSMGDYEKAETQYQKSLAIFEEVLGKKHPSTVTSYNNLGGVYLEKGEIDRAFLIFTETNNSEGLGRCHLARKEFWKASNQFSGVIERGEAGGSKESVIGASIGLGLASEGLGEYGEARRHFSHAIETMESQREALGGTARETFAGGRAGSGFSRLEAYEGLIRVLQKEKPKGYEKEALRCSERVKSRVFVEMLATRGAKGRVEADRSLLARDHEFQVKFTTLKRQLATLGELGDKAIEGSKEEAQKKLGEVAKQYEAFLREVKLQNAELASLLTVDVPTIENLQRQLDLDTTLVEFFTGKEKTYVWLVTCDQTRMFEIPAGQKKLEEMVNSVLLPNVSNAARRPELRMILVPEERRASTAQERMKNREVFMDATEKVYHTLVSPLRGEIKTKGLIVVPHGALHKIPFSTLHDGGRCLLEDFEITVLPSASVIPHVVSKRKPDAGALLALGNPKTDYPPLGFAEQEVDMVGRGFPNKQVYTREKATEVRVKREAQYPSVLHLACHGEFNDRQPLQSGLLLAMEGDEDGKLQVHEVFGLDLKNVNLVTLSACQTALGKVTTGDDMVGLSRAFIYAGTPSLLGTLWDVDDASTSLLMERFYDNWRTKGMSKPEALRQAQLSIRSMPRYQHPYYWAGFVLMGDWR